MPKSVWDLLVEWYRGGPEFPRKVIIGKDGKPINESVKSMAVSRTNKLNEVFLKICESYNYISTSSARLWLKSEDENQWTLFGSDDMSKCVEDVDITPNDIFMVEVKINNDWPRDHAGDSQQVRDWKNFEVGDKIDVK